MEFGNATIKLELGYAELLGTKRWFAPETICQDRDGDAIIEAEIERRSDNFALRIAKNCA